MSFTIADESFATKSALISRCQEILKSTPDGVAVCGQEEIFLTDLFSHHDEWLEKADGGVCHISTQTTPQGTRCFVLVKQKGCSIDISFHHIVRLMQNCRTSTLQPQPLRDFRNACRNAINDDIVLFRRTALQQTKNCLITNELLTNNNCAVDHAPPKTFDKLLFDFCVSNKVNPCLVKVGTEGGTVAVLQNTDLATKWKAYHKAHADLRLISKSGNLKIPKLKIAWENVCATTNSSDA